MRDPFGAECATAREGPGRSRRVQTIMKPAPILSWLGPIAIAVGLLGASCAPPPTPVTPLAAPTEPAVRELIDRKIARARLEPQEPDHHGSLGLAYAANRMWPEAEAALALAVRLAPEDAWWGFHHSLAQWEVGEIEGARATMEGVARALPRDPQIRCWAGAMALDDGDLEGARSHFSDAAQQVSAPAAAHAGLGEALLAQGDAAGAAAALEQALRSDPANGSAHYLIGLAYRELGRVSEAEQELTLGRGARRQLPAEDPRSREKAGYVVNRQGKLTRAQSLLARRQHREARAVLDELLAQDPGDVEVLTNLAAANLALGDLPGAERALADAMRVDPEEPAVWINRSACQLTRGDVAGSLESARNAVRLGPNMGSAHWSEALALHALQRFEEARNALREAVRFDPARVEAHAMLGEISMRMGSLDEARGHFTDLLRLAPGDVVGHLSLGFVLADLGEPDAAREQLESARTLAPSHPAIADLEQRLEP